MLLLADLVLLFKKRTKTLKKTLNKKIKHAFIKKSIVSLKKLVKYNENIADVSLKLIKAYLGYLNVYFLTLKIVVILAKRFKLVNIKTTLNFKTKISVITLKVILKVNISITRNNNIALKTIIKTKSKFVNFANNLPVIIKNAFIKTRFYIINTFSFKLILSFLFIRKTKLTFRYFKNTVDKLVFVCI